MQSSSSPNASILETSVVFPSPPVSLGHGPASSSPLYFSPSPVSEINPGTPFSPSNLTQDELQRIYLLQQQKAQKQRSSRPSDSPTTAGLYNEDLCGIGIVLSRCDEGESGQEGDLSNILVIEAVTAGGSAEREGTIQKGDRLVSVMGQSTENCSDESLRSLVLGSPGSEVTVEVLRDGSSRLQVTLVRGNFAFWESHDRQSASAAGEDSIPTEVGDVDKHNNDAVRDVKTDSVGRGRKSTHVVIGKPPTRKSASPHRGVPPTAADARQPLESFDVPLQPGVRLAFQEQVVYTDVAVQRPLEEGAGEEQPSLQRPLHEKETAVALVTDGEGKRPLEESRGEVHADPDLSIDSFWEAEEDAKARTSAGVRDALARTLQRAKLTEDRLTEMTSERDALRRTLEAEGDVLRRVAQNEGNRLERALAEVELERDALRGELKEARSERDAVRCRFDEMRGERDALGRLVKDLEGDAKVEIKEIEEARVREKEEADSRISDLEAMVRGLEEVIGENRLRFDQVNAENGRLGKALQALEASSDEDKRKALAIERDLEDARGRQQTAEERGGALWKELEDAEKRHAVALGDLAQQSEHVCELQAKHKDALELERAKVASSELMLAEARQELSAARCELDVLGARQNEDAEALEDARGRNLELERIKGDAEAQTQEAKTTLVQREEELARIRVDLKEAETSAECLRESSIKILRDLEQSKAKLVACESALEAARKAHLGKDDKIEKLQAELEKSQKMRGEAEYSIESLTQQLAQSQKNPEQLSVVLSERDGLMSYSEMVVSERDTLKADKELLANECERTARERDGLASVKSELDLENARLKSRITLLEDALKKEYASPVSHTHSSFAIAPKTLLAPTNPKSPSAQMFVPIFRGEKDAIAIAKPKVSLEIDYAPFQTGAAKTSEAHAGQSASNDSSASPFTAEDRRPSSPLPPVLVPPDTIDPPYHHPARPSSMWIRKDEEAHSQKNSENGGSLDDDDDDFGGGSFKDMDIPPPGCLSPPPRRPPRLALFGSSTLPPRLPSPALATGGGEGKPPLSPTVLNAKPIVFEKTSKTRQSPSKLDFGSEAAPKGTSIAFRETPPPTPLSPPPAQPSSAGTEEEDYVLTELGLRVAMKRTMFCNPLSVSGRVIPCELQRSHDGGWIFPPDADISGQIAMIRADVHSVDSQSLSKSVAATKRGALAVIISSVNRIGAVGGSELAERHKPKLFPAGLIDAKDEHMVSGQVVRMVFRAAIPDNNNNRNTFASGITSRAT